MCYLVLVIGRYRMLRLELFKGVKPKQDRTVCSIPNCDIFVYLMNHENIEIVKAVIAFFYQVLTRIGH